MEPNSSSPVAFTAMSASRWLAFGGIAIIAGGMLFGDIFAVFVLHQNGNRTGALLMAAVRDLKAQDADSIRADFQQIGGNLEDRGTKVDTHVHMTDAGYLALLLALVQPFVRLPHQAKTLLAKLFVTGGILLPLGIFLIHYVGLTYSPFPMIGWASVLADGAGLLLIVVVIVELWGIYLHFRGGRTENTESDLLHPPSWATRTLLSGGTVLVLLGFAYGAWYSAFDLYRHEARETAILGTMIGSTVTSQADPMTSIADYGGLAAERAVKIAAHSHVIEFGLLAILLSFVQPYVFLSERWRRRWIIVLLAGSLILPIFVRLELDLGLVAGGIADIGGLMVIIALIAMLVGVVRHSGNLGRRFRSTIMSQARKLLIFGGLALACLGMAYGLYYAAFVEHQTLDGMGGALTDAFVKAAERHMPESSAAIDAYARTKYVYVRQVDVHSHWIGLAMLLIALGAAFDRVNFAERTRLWMATALLVGSVVFPLGVLLQTLIEGPLPSALAIVGSALVISTLALTAVGFARSN